MDRVSYDLELYICFCTCGGLYIMDDNWAFVILGMWPTYNTYTKVCRGVMYRKSFKGLSRISLVGIFLLRNGRDLGTIELNVNLIIETFHRFPLHVALDSYARV